MPPLEVRFYRTASGRDVIVEFLDGLPIKVKAATKCMAMIGRLASGELHLYPKNRTHRRSGIWELRVPHDGEQYRFLYCVEGAIAYLLVPMHKKTQKIDEHSIRLAEQRRTEILSGRS